MCENFKCEFVKVLALFCLLFDKLDIKRIEALIFFLSTRILKSHRRPARQKSITYLERSLYDVLARGTSILGEVRNVEIPGPTQQLLCSKYHDFLAVFPLAHSKINQIS